MSDSAIKPDASVISQERIEQAIMMRYSPLPDLSMATLASQLNQFRIGELRPAARTWEIMMERDGDLAVPAEKLFSDIARLPWEIEKEDDSAEAEADFAFLKYFYTNLTATSVLEQSETGGLNLLIRQLMTAHAYRYSAHEIVLQINSAAKSEVTAQFNHCPVWFFENRKGRLAFLQREGEINGQPLVSGRWLTAVGKGLMRQCSIAYFTKWGPLSDAMFFAKRFGLPAIHGETTATKNSAEWNDFETALVAFANGWIMQTSGMGNCKVNLIEANKGGSGTLPFNDLIERADRVYARCFRGGDLSTQSREGGEVAGANPQEGEKRIVLEDGGQWVTDILNARVDEPMIAYAFNRRPKAWICIRPPKATDATREIAALKAARELGVPISIETARERLELPAPEEGEELVGASQASPSPGGEGRPSSPPSVAFLLRRTGVAALRRVEGEGEPSTVIANANESKSHVATAAATVLQPILAAYDERLQRILTITDPALRKQRWDEIQSELATLEADHLSDPIALVRAFEQINARAFVAGLSNSKALANYDEDQPRDEDGKWADAIRGVVSDAGKNIQRGVDFGLASDVAVAKAAAQGVNIAGFQKRLEADAVRHTLSRHSNPKTEMDRNQVPVTASDFDHLPHIMDRPDKVSKGDKDFELDTLVFEKRLDANHRVVVQVRTGKQKLAVKTFTKVRVPHA